MHILRSLGPAVARTSSIEAARAGIGACLALALTGLFLLSPSMDHRLGMYLVAPFGATSVLLFAVPNSPLAQPWSAVVGNTLAALVGVSACLWIYDPALRIAVAVGGAISVTILCRAIHPPAGAVAMTAAMSPAAVQDLGFWFALSPIALGTVILVIFATGYARLTGRRYPFRQFEDADHQSGKGPDPMERLGLSEEELTNLLERHRQSFNVGVEDLARLIGAAELQAATHHTGTLTAADIMSRNPVTVTPDTSLATIADLFRRHRFTSLPVAGHDAKFMGIIFQIDLISRAREDSLRLNRGFRSALIRLLDRNRDKTVCAENIMSVAGPRATITTPIGALLPMMVGGGTEALPVLENGNVTGIVTQTDIIAALAQRILHHDT